jgi:hypothetical protein
MDRRPESFLSAATARDRNSLKFSVGTILPVQVLAELLKPKGANVLAARERDYLLAMMRQVTGFGFRLLGRSISPVSIQFFVAHHTIFPGSYIATGLGTVEPSRNS